MVNHSSLLPFNIGTFSHRVTLLCYIKSRMPGWFKNVVWIFRSVDWYIVFHWWQYCISCQVWFKYWRFVSNRFWRLFGFKVGLGLAYGVLRHFQQYFSYIVAVSFIGGGNRCTWRKPPTCHKSLTNFIT